MPREQLSLSYTTQSLHAHFITCTSPQKRPLLRALFIASSALLLLHPSILAQRSEPIPSHEEVAAASASTAGSAYIPVDSWIYSASLRLYYLGYLPTAYLGLRPWTRASLAHMLSLSQESLHSKYAPAEAVEINARLSRELAPELAGDRSPSLRAASAYTRIREINGNILDDSFHVGQTIVNDYGRPNQPGFNNVSGISAEAQGGRFSVMVRAEYQHAPSAFGYSPSVASQLAAIDGTPDVPQTTIPLGVISGQDTAQVLEANASVHLLGHEISFGKSDEWLGPALGASMGWSNNAQDIYSFRINRIEPLYVPGLSRYVGLFRYDFMVGELQGHQFPSKPLDSYGKGQHEGHPRSRDWLHALRHLGWAWPKVRGAGRARLHRTHLQRPHHDRHIFPQLFQHHCPRSPT